MWNISWWFALGGVLFLGVQTSMSPCPLATNIAAISYITRRCTQPTTVILSGLLYTFGRVLAYLGLAIGLLTAIFSDDASVTRFLQVQIHGWLGPILIVIGLALLGWLSISLGSVSGDKMQKIADRLGHWSALPLGVLFALAFCPTSAATFLAMLTLALQFESRIIFPTIFGIGTAIPVIFFSGVIVVNAKFLGRAFGVVGRIDYWTRCVTGTGFILLGIWFSSRYVYGIL